MSRWLDHHVACERRYISGGRFAPPKRNVCKLELPNNFCDVKSANHDLAPKNPEQTRSRFLFGERNDRRKDIRLQLFSASYRDFYICLLWVLGQQLRSLLLSRDLLVQIFMRFQVRFWNTHKSICVGQFLAHEHGELGTWVQTAHASFVLVHFVAVFSTSDLEYSRASHARCAEKVTKALGARLVISAGPEVGACAHKPSALTAWPHALVILFFQLVFSQWLLMIRIRILWPGMLTELSKFGISRNIVSETLLIMMLHHVSIRINVVKATGSINFSAVFRVTFWSAIISCFYSSIDIKKYLVKQTDYLLNPWIQVWSPAL